jgi:hypothetical protein
MASKMLHLDSDLRSNTSVSARGYKTTNNTTPQNSEHASSSLNTTTMGYGLQRTCLLLQRPLGSSMTCDSS